MRQANDNEHNNPRHIAIIMDGNGRWAKKRGMSRNFGHQQGTKNLQKIIEVCLEIGVSTLTVFAFSTENWSRPQKEIDYLMQIALDFFENNRIEAQKRNIRIKIIGEKEKLSADLIEKIRVIEEETRHNQDLTFVVALNYGSQQELTAATKAIAQKVVNNEMSLDDIRIETIGNNLYTKDLPPVDFLIRTSGELRISNFLLWQIAYAELYFTKKLWPDFNKSEFIKAIEEFKTRQRRFGGLEASNEDTN